MRLLKTIGAISLIALFGLSNLKNVDAIVRVPVAQELSTFKNNKLTIDYSNANQGYIMVKYNGDNSKVKIQVTKDTTYTYDVLNKGNYETFPLSEGNGNYSVKVFENISGNQYAQAGSQNVSVTLENEFNPFLYPSQYVNFVEGSQSTILSNSLKGESVMATVTNVYNYVVDNISYDNVKASNVQSGYVPNNDNTLASKNGICFDYASLMCAMLRVQDVPSKLIIGYQGSQYHAWISVYSNETGWIDNVISFDGVNWVLMDPTFASTGGRQYGNCSASGGYTMKYNY